MNMKTKKWYMVFGMIFIASSIMAQNNAFGDDIYFSRKSNNAGAVVSQSQNVTTSQVEPVRRETPVVLEATIPGDRDVDEYNRRYINDNRYVDQAVDSVDTTEYVDGELTQKIIRFQDPSKVVISGTDNLNVYWDGEGYELNFDDPSSANLTININNSWSPGWGWNSWGPTWGWGWNSPWSPSWSWGWNSWGPGWGWGWNSSWGPGWGWGWNSWGPGWGWNSWWGSGWGGGWSRPSGGWWAGGGNFRNNQGYNRSQFARNNTRNNSVGTARDGANARNYSSTRAASSIRSGISRDDIISGSARQSGTRNQSTTGVTARPSVTRESGSSVTRGDGSSVIRGNSVSTPSAAPSRTRVSPTNSSSSSSSVSRLSSTRSSSSGSYSTPSSSSSSSGSYSAPSSSSRSSGGGSSYSGGGGGRSSGGGGGRR